MTNIFNDLNKMVNTIQKVDRLLSEKPKRPRVKYITKRFTEKEIWWLKESLECMLGFDNTDEDVNTIKELKKKLV